MNYKYVKYDPKRGKYIKGVRGWIENDEDDTSKLIGNYFNLKSIKLQKIKEKEYFNLFKFRPHMSLGNHND